MADTPEEIRKHLKLYWIIGGVLFLGTVITWFVAEFLDLGAPGLDAVDIAIGLLIATIKSSCVALVFMHLNHERPMVYRIMFFTFIFFAGLMLLCVWALNDPIIRH